MPVTFYADTPDKDSVPQHQFTVMGYDDDHGTVVGIRCANGKRHAVAFRSDALSEEDRDAMIAKAKELLIKWAATNA